MENPNIFGDTITSYPSRDYPPNLLNFCRDSLPILPMLKSEDFTYNLKISLLCRFCRKNESFITDFNVFNAQGHLVHEDNVFNLIEEVLGIFDNYMDGSYLTFDLGFLMSKYEKIIINRELKSPEFK